MTIGDQIKKIREQNKLTQIQLSNKLNVSRQNISGWERGKYYPDILTLLKISDEFNLTLDDLIRGDTEMVNKMNKFLTKKRNFKWVVGISCVLVAIVAYLVLNFRGFFTFGHSYLAYIFVILFLLELCIVTYTLISYIRNKKYNISLVLSMLLFLILYVIQFF
ncbi:helix-turn-helix domain-containing protein [Lactobacillus sp. S2-2]|uniref:helix-turn-helix domain-containing protein n=1 Tax=Lactobacillus sp. S2-2 TaxID=2692917 RepID=UPI001F3ED931|nr:helix-turn-helix transcriptional regulator [Lactobacillus sp. S2-2]MCF6515892.1 helix-turn-helix domain-containing protein [Lactobacillus sp. S2-2]